MKTFTHISLALFAILSIGTTISLAEDDKSVLAAFLSPAPGLSVLISPTTNRVTTLRDLEFSVVITNSGSTNVTIYPRMLVNGVGTIEVFNRQGMMITQHPHPRFFSPTSRPQIDTETPNEHILKPKEAFLFTYKLSVGDYFDATPKGKYRAKGGWFPSNEVEFTIE
jgi:hypothetical protein